MSGSAKDVYDAERAEIRKRRQVAFPEYAPLRSDNDQAACPGAPGQAGERIEESLVGLALSGGGLRSATFNLGLLQAFRKHGLLRYVDYLSSVSGGGYTAGYLAVVAHDQKREKTDGEQTDEPPANGGGSPQPADRQVAAEHNESAKRAGSQSSSRSAHERYTNNGIEDQAEPEGGGNGSVANDQQKTERPNEGPSETKESEWSNDRKNRCYHDLEFVPGKRQPGADEKRAREQGWLSALDNHRFGKCGEYLSRPFEFGAYYLSTTIPMLLLFGSGIMALALLLAVVWRSLDMPVVRDHWNVLNWRVEPWTAFIPSLGLLGLWLVLWLSGWLADRACPAWHPMHVRIRRSKNSDHRQRSSLKNWVLLLVSAIILWGGVFICHAKALPFALLVLLLAVPFGVSAILAPIRGFLGWLRSRVDLKHPWLWHINSAVCFGSLLLLFILPHVDTGVYQIETYAGLFVLLAITIGIYRNWLKKADLTAFLIPSVVIVAAGALAICCASCVFEWPYHPFFQHEDGNNGGAWADARLRPGNLVMSLAIFLGSLLVVAWCWLGTKRLTDAVFRMMLASPLIGLSILVGNGSLGLGWVAEIIGLQNPELTGQKVFREPFLIFVALCLIALIRYRSLLGSRRTTAGFWERLFSRIVVSGIIIGVPLAMVGWAARENISGYATYRDPNFVHSDLLNPRAFLDLNDQADGRGKEDLNGSSPLFNLDASITLSDAQDDMLRPNRGLPCAVLWLVDQGFHNDLCDDSNMCSHKERLAKIQPPSDAANKISASEPAEYRKAMRNAWNDAEAELASDEYEDKLGISCEKALRLALALERYTESELKGGEYWDRDKRGFLDAEHGWFTRAWLLASSPFRDNQATAYVKAQRFARLVEKKVATKLSEQLADPDLTRKLGRRVRARAVENEVDSGKNELVAADEYIGKRAADLEEGRKLRRYWAMATDHLTRKEPSEMAGDKGAKDSDRRFDIVAAGRSLLPSPAFSMTFLGRFRQEEATPDLLVELRVDEPKTYWTEHRRKEFNRLLLQALYPQVFKPRVMVSTPVVVEKDQKTRLGYLAFFGLVFAVLFSIVPVNPISPMHHFYRKKLDRQFLRPLNEPDDPDDFEGRPDLSPQLHKLNGHKERGAPYPLFLASLHMGCRTTADKRQLPMNGTSRTSKERHHPLMFSPVYSGSPSGGYLRTEDYVGKSFRVADAVAISGAAISPMALASGPMRWVLSAFNLRTGQWLFNPVLLSETGKRGPTWRQQRRVCPWHVYREWFREEEPDHCSERNNPRTLRDCLKRIGQLLGQSTSSRNAPEPEWNVAAAADGGFHEYLGMEELLQRRCRLIIVSDASCNTGDDEFEVIADAVRTARSRLGIEILDLDDDRPLDLGRLRLRRPDADRHHSETRRTSTGSQWRDSMLSDGQRHTSKDDNLKKLSDQHYIMGRIIYERPDSVKDATHSSRASEGILLYLRMTMTGDEDVDLRQYHDAHPTFPAEPTTNQFFDEVMVESFRALGYHTGQMICRELSGHYDYDQLTLRQSNSDACNQPNYFAIHELIDSLVAGYIWEATPDRDRDDRHLHSYPPVARTVKGHSGDACPAWQRELRVLSEYERNPQKRQELIQLLYKYLGVHNL